MRKDLLFRFALLFLATLSISGITAPLVSAATACPTTVTSLSNVSATCITAAHTKLRADGFVDNDVTRAIKAFQIEAGISAQGKSGYGNFGPATYSSLMSGKGMAKINAAPDRRYNGIVVDKSDQTMMVYRYGKLVNGSLISTGLSTATENRETRLGTFKIYNSKTSADGWVRSSLQSPTADPAMYRPYYFDGGEAVHGTPAEWSLGQKASHGCVRTAQNIQDKLIAQKLLYIGQTVVIQN